jgi:hypothetical protein
MMECLVIWVFHCLPVDYCVSLCCKVRICSLQVHSNASHHITLHHITSSVFPRSRTKIVAYECREWQSCIICSPSSSMMSSFESEKREDDDIRRRTYTIFRLRPFVLTRVISSLNSGARQKKRNRQWGNKDGDFSSRERTCTTTNGSNHMILMSLTLEISRYWNATATVWNFLERTLLLVC